jgi:UDPglucose 6-dehydrogenase
MSVRIGFAGMTHLGVISALAAAERGCLVIGFDPDESVTSALSRGVLPVDEPGLPALLQKHAKEAERVTFANRLDSLSACDLVYIARDTPTDHSGASDVSSIRALVDLVIPALRRDAVLVVLSQVPPGFTRSIAWPPAQRFCHVETLIFGRAVARALEPERFIVGCADPSVSLPVPLSEYLNAFGCPVLPMRYESAELAKISINMCLVASVSVANTLAELCEQVGADWRDIVPALRLDQRIGPHAYLSPGLGISGGNLERDLATVCRLADAHGTDAGVVRAWIDNSVHRRDWALARVHDRVIARVPEPTLAVLGLAYKENTASTKNSPSLALLAALHPFPVRVYDPVVLPSKEFHPKLSGASTALDTCTDADALVIMTPWPEFRDLRPSDITARLRGRTVIDPYGMLDSRACRAEGLDHVVLGAPGMAT